MVRLYTRTGDRGQTGLAGGVRIDKDSLRVAAFGALDEANSQIGVAAAHIPVALKEVQSLLLRTQHEFFVVMAELAAADGRAKEKERISSEHVTRVEREIDRLVSHLEPPKAFVLPRGGPSGAHLHVARTVTRRAERELVRLNRSEPVRPVVLTYVNRVSDLLFALALIVNRDEGFAEIPPDYTV